MKFQHLLALAALCHLCSSVCWLTEYYKTDDFANQYPPMADTLQGAKDFYEWCTWFDIKEAYYWAKQVGDDDLRDILETDLLKLAEQRKEIILNALSFNFGADCQRKADENFLSMGAKRHFDLVEFYFTGQKFFIECEDYAYLLNSFGSTTATSDFDYSVYRLNLNGRMPTLEEEVDAIKQISKGLYFLEMEIELNVCGGTSAPDCLDSNGYPEIMALYYNEFYPSVALLELKDGRGLDSTRFSNLMSAKILRYCAVGPVYFAKIKSLNYKKKMIDKHVNRMVKDCYDSMIYARQIYRRTMGFSEEHRDTKYEETIKLPYHKDNIMGNRTMYIAGNAKSYRRSIKQMVNYFSGRGNFNECISHIDQPFFYLKKGNVHRNPKRIMKRGTVIYEVYNDIYYVPSSYDKRKVEYTNQILLPFLGACHIWATEAYVTFGALHFVKKEKLIISDRHIMRCDCNVETFVENFGIMIFHLVEMGKHKNWMNSRVDNKQGISDTFSKYLRRAMLGATLPCLNDFDVKVVSVFKRSSSKETFKRNKIFRFFKAIKGVDQDLKNKKDIYFHSFKGYFDHYVLKNLIKESIDFFMEMHHHLFKFYDVKKLYTHPKGNLF